MTAKSQSGRSLAWPLASSTTVILVSEVGAPITPSGKIACLAESETDQYFLFLPPVSAPPAHAAGRAEQVRGILVMFLFQRLYEGQTLVSIAPTHAWRPRAMAPSELAFPALTVTGSLMGVAVILRYSLDAVLRFIAGDDRHLRPR